jgi:hypothetical protein
VNEREQILTKVSEMRNRITTLTQADKDYIKNVHKVVLRYEFVGNGCSDCYGNALSRIFLHLKEYDIMQKSNYQLKNGVVLQSANISDAVTNANITDELAEKFLKENAKRLNFFAVFPAKWNKKAIELGLMAADTDTKNEDKLTLAEKAKALAEKAKAEKAELEAAAKAKAEAAAAAENKE